MFDKYKIAIIIVAAIALGAVGYKYSQNYIVFESEGIHIKFPAQPNDVKRSNEFQPANVPTNTESDSNRSEFVEMSPSSKSNIDKELEEHRVFDDIMKICETAMPLAAVLIPMYLQKRNKSKKKEKEE